MSGDVRIRLDIKPRALTCNHDLLNGTLEQINVYTYRCRACGMLFKLGAMERAMERAVER